MRHRQNNDLGRARGRRQIGACDRGVLALPLDRFGRGLGLCCVARTDDDGISGVRPAQRQRAAFLAGAAEDGENGFCRCRHHALILSSVALGESSTSGASGRASKEVERRSTDTSSYSVVRCSGTRSRLEISASIACGENSWPCSVPAAREMLSFMSVPPRSLAPARKHAAAPVGPILTHEVWMFGISGLRTSLDTACISTASRKVGPLRDWPRRYIGASMLTNGSGTNSVKPPVSACRSRIASRD